MQRILHALFHVTFSWNGGQLDGETKWLHISITISDRKPGSRWYVVLERCHPKVER